MKHAQSRLHHWVGQFEGGKIPNKTEIDEKDRAKNSRSIWANSFSSKEYLNIRLTLLHVYLWTSHRFQFCLLFVCLLAAGCFWVFFFVGHNTWTPKATKKKKLRKRRTTLNWNILKKSTQKYENGNLTSRTLPIICFSFHSVGSSFYISRL